MQLPGHARSLVRASRPNPRVRAATVDQGAPLYTKFSQPVYSLATGGPSPSLNLVTYASPVAIQPDRLFALGLYLGTVSHANMKAQRRGVLQVLQTQHAPLFGLLGKTSARDVDKHAAVEEAGFRLAQRYGVMTLEDAACVLELVVVSDFMPCGDHDVVLCRVAGFENLCVDPRVLYTDELRRTGFLPS
ncbi:hypothetical protein TSOC_012759 [Tetrabaena socialis]|uniref:Flavin reductase like domain-containing protein n=1 Tax=Tetrabaena socialis TaxID=47790 RepID=A0A2J7ZM73_9CHLO|nr:hypothetical protein TSOC_012759 [Tetrabaena socialis]|eukprot:PNH01371.1 hypothetical protein TSOC_012759 [Tetrabaena socialis]